MKNHHLYSPVGDKNYRRHSTQVHPRAGDRWALAGGKGLALEAPPHGGVKTYCDDENSGT